SIRHRSTSLSFPLSLHDALPILLHAERDTMGFLVDADDLHLDRLADGEDFRRMVDAAPCHVGNVQETVDAAEVNERTVIGDVLRSEEHTSELQSRENLVCRLLLE